MRMDGYLMKSKGKLLFFLCVSLITVAVGCAKQPSKKTEASSVSVTSTKPEQQKPTKSLAVGKILSTEQANPDVAYKVANKQTIFYFSLKNFGKKSDIISDNATARGEIFGATKKVETTTGTYYKVIRYYANGFENASSPEGSADDKEIADFGYVKSTGLKPFFPVASEWTYKQKQPYYLGNPYAHRIWSAPAKTVHYTYITHVFDRLATTQLYATKEMVTYNGMHYVYLETAKRPLGWVYKSSKTLIAGWYQDPGKQLLKTTSHEKMIVKKQSKKSAGNRVDASDSTALPQRVYLICNKKRHTMRTLVMGMDNRPIVIHFKHNRAVKVQAYQYWRQPWKTITSKKKLSTHFLLSHDFIEGMYSTVHFYSKRSQKLVRVKTLGSNSQAAVWIYKDGRVMFKTKPYKHTANYPLKDFN